MDRPRSQHAPRTEVRHGGNIHQASQRYGIDPDVWLDLSTGINPRPWPRPGPPPPMDPFERLHALPGADAMAKLLESARAFYAVPEGVDIVAAPGSEILIRALPQMLAGPTSMVPTTYGSYREAFELAGAGLAWIDDPRRFSPRPLESLLLVNPNNPDGRTCSFTELENLVASIRKSGGRLIVDEAFADAEPPVSLVPHLNPGDPVVVLKSFGKFFGLPGLRLGFAIGERGSLERLQALVGDWPVSVPALEIGRAALEDRNWQRSARRWLADRSEALDAVLARHFDGPILGCRHFRTVRDHCAAYISDQLGWKGILVRHFRDQPDILRIGLAAEKTDLERLGNALAAVVED